MLPKKNRKTYLFTKVLLNYDNISTRAKLLTNNETTKQSVKTANIANIYIYIYLLLLCVMCA